MKLVPNYGECILESLEEGEKNYGGIIVSDIGEQKLIKATILDIAPIFNFNLGTFVEPKFKVGDVVLIPPLGTQKQKIDRKEYMICSVSDLKAKIQE